MLIIGAVALIAFGPDQLPKVARKAGQAMRDVQNTSQSFIREMERAADEQERPAWTPPPAPAPYPDIVDVRPEAAQHDPVSHDGVVHADPLTHEGERGRAASAHEENASAD